ncbi:hypothetical protein E2C01_069146 [Portunus trituberculatus]|uniref:Uncharacterized protein n=1 Tax=Portunus trituberculatus TaxID=210409 RepID=A0A5B7HPB4_PORTR|nr:hypothetical protein [Portunus trituberculatus]
MLRYELFCIIKSISDTIPKTCTPPKQDEIDPQRDPLHFLTAVFPDAPRPPNLTSFQPLLGHGRGGGSLAPGGWLCKLPLSSHSPLPSVGPQFPRRAHRTLYHLHTHARGDLRRTVVSWLRCAPPPRASPQAEDALCFERTGSETSSLLSADHLHAPEAAARPGLTKVPGSTKH